MLHFRRFITALIALLVCYGLYAVTVAPFFEPPPIARKALANKDEVFTPRRATNKFADLFEPGSWELENPKIVENADCTLLIQDYKPLDDGRMELKPCTLIFYTQGDKSTTDPAGAPMDAQARRPIVLRCPQGAILQFDRPLDLGKAQFGRLMGGRLSGEVTIFSPPSKPNANDALRMTTRNVQIDTERAFTPQEVEFQYGSSYGRGRDMTIYLLPREGIVGKQGTPIGGVRALQLAHVEHLHIETDGPGLLPTADPSGVQALSVDASKPKRPTSPLEIRCKGPLVYDFEQQIAALDDQVEVSRINPDAAPDRLLCSRLMLYMAAPKSALPADDKLATPTPEAATATPAAAGDSPKAALSKLHRLVAVGSPVVLEAPSSGAFVVASRIEYSPLTRRLALESGEGAKQVVLEHNQDKFEARTLEYELAEEGGRLGRLWAAGPGTLKMTQLRDGQSQTIAAQWLKELRIRPHEQNQVLSLVEGAAVEVNSMGSFAANELHVWVLEAPAGDARAASVPGGKPGKASIVPDRLLAVGEVRVDSPQLLARAKRLEAWFVDRPIVDGAEPLPGAPQPSAQGGPIAQQPAGPPGVTPLPAESPPQQQVSIVGELVQMQIARDGDKTALEDLTIQGGLRIEETRTAKPDDTPLVIVGDDLQLHDGASGNAKLEVRGRPAEVSARGLTMSGPSIHLHKGENRLWIDGPGKASLPVPDKERKSLQPPPAEPERMNVFWRRSMNFDGLTATLLGEVQASTKLQRALAESLEVTLAQPVNFAKPDAKANTEVARLKFDGGVNLENTTLDELGNQTSLELLQAPNMLLDRRTGELRAVGAGWLTSIRKGSPAGLTTPSAVPAAAPVVAAAGNAPLTHLHVEFEGGIVGDINKHEVSFQRQVRTIYAAVDDWDTRITMKDIDRQGIPALGEKGALLSSERLTVREMLAGRAGAGGQKWVELEAVGNTQVEGQSFTARADRISYTTDKEQLVMQGDGRNDAELWHQQAKGGQYSYTAATKILYWRQTNDVQFEGGKVLDLQQLSNAKPPPFSRKR